MESFDQIRGVADQTVDRLPATFDRIWAGSSECWPGSTKFGAGLHHVDSFGSLRPLWPRPSSGCRWRPSTMASRPVTCPAAKTNLVEAGQDLADTGPDVCRSRPLLAAKNKRRPSVARLRLNSGCFRQSLAGRSPKMTRNRPSSAACGTQVDHMLGRCNTPACIPPLACAEIQHDMVYPKNVCESRSGTTLTRPGIQPTALGGSARNNGVQRSEKEMLTRPISDVCAGTDAGGRRQSSAKTGREPRKQLQCQLQCQIRGQVVEAWPCRRRPCPDKWSKDPRARAIDGRTGLAAVEC